MILLLALSFLLVGPRGPVLVRPDIPLSALTEPDHQEAIYGSVKHECLQELIPVAAPIALGNYADSYRAKRVPQVMREQDYRKGEKSKVESALKHLLVGLDVPRK